MSKSLLVAVGSNNPVKINAVRLAFKSVFPNQKWLFEGSKVSSGVSDQPMSDVESIKGAKNRAKKAIKSLNADFGVGLEGGLQKIGKDYYEAGWIVVVDKSSRIGIGSSIKMMVPAKMMKLIKKGVELGEVTDIVFSKKNSKQKEGFFGTMTNNVIDRTRGYSNGVVAALARFVQADVFE